jgi:probable rRNA maturation factor
MTRRARAVVVTVQNAARSTGVPKRAELERWALHALASDVRGELTIRIVDERESAELNSRYRGKKGPTNVLSFPAGGSDRHGWRECRKRREQFAAEVPAAGGEELLPYGDVVICAAVVEREAREQGKRLAAHWAHMVVHGALHLQGYDHENVRDAGIMETRERALLAELGFPDPYSIK